MLNLMKEFELQKMKQYETIKEYLHRLLGIVKKVKLLGTKFFYYIYKKKSPCNHARKTRGIHNHPRKYKRLGKRVTCLVGTRATRAYETRSSG